MRDIRKEIAALRARIAQRKERHEAVIDLEARLVLLVAKLIRREMRDERKQRRAA